MKKNAYVDAVRIGEEGKKKVKNVIKELQGVGTAVSGRGNLWAYGNRG
ncbi:MAG: hypothetical protein RBU28_10530 [Bacteroidales bacterium]|jgi:hypothetical protein|nr:hypothetical protein [Bacteroidales bacterium]